ncbi:MAG: SEC-C domain-containing protein [Nitrospinae bacterium]|nr:SEC-C domain-containing protein [Nitrospinota bacterium]
MTFRFEEENYQNVYVLEDYYCTNPFCDCNHATVSLYDEEHDRRISFLLNFNKTHGPLPNHPKLEPLENEIVKGFVKDLRDEAWTLLRQRYLEAKGYGERNPMSYLVFESGRYVNYMEMFPKNNLLLDFSQDGQRYFAEDSYEMDPRNGNKDARLAFYKFDPKEDKQPPLFNYTYFLDEKSREEEDKKLGGDELDILAALNQFVPNLADVVKSRYKQVKQLGKELMKASPKTGIATAKINRNDLCPCGSGKKYKKCCALKLN